MIKRILVAIDGSEPAWRALDVACDLAATYGAALLAVHVITHVEVPEGLRRFARDEHLAEPYDFLAYDMIAEGLAEETRRRAKAKGVEDLDWMAPKGTPAEAILPLAEEGGVDMIVMGRRGFSELRHLLMGSVSSKIMHCAPCTCLTVT